MNEFTEGKHHRLICDKLEAVERGEIKRLMIFTPPRHTKALALDTPIPTPSGWTRMGDLRVGDKVFDETGKPCNVVAVSEIWKNRECYTVTTDCGDEIVADAAHNWRVRLDKGGYRTLRTTKFLADRTTGRNAMIDRAQALECKEANLPIAPYTLGVWLGDGCSQHATITGCDADTYHIRRFIEEDGFVCTDRITKMSFGVLGLQKLLRENNLRNNKHIPKEYFRASNQQRLRLLQGLIDTDGCVSIQGQVFFTNTNRLLVDGVQELVRSLGVKATVQEARAVLNGKDCGSCWKVSFYMQGCARLPRKLARTHDATRTKNTYIVVSHASPRDTVCIQVDSASSLFLCGKSMTPTHNSELVSKRFPAWFLGRNPWKQFIAASYGADLVQSFGRDVRNLINTEEYKKIFPNMCISSDSSAKDQWHTSGNGVYVAVGVGGGLTGKGGHVCVIDDPVKDRQDAESPVIRERIWDWYRSVLRTRLMPGASIILVMTRWHPGDLAGLLIDAMHSGGEQWEIVNLPAIATSPDDALGRNLGEALWPEWYPVEALKTIESSVGPREWAALYQQEPTTGGEFFSTSSFLVDDKPVDIPQVVKFVFATVDTTQKGGKGRDGTAVSYWAYQELNLPGQYPLTLLDWDIVEHEAGLLDMWFPSVFEYLECLAVVTKARLGTIGAFVEDKAAGTVLLQQAPRYDWPMHPIDSMLTAVGKDARAINAASYVTKGLVKITAHAFEKQIAFRGAMRNHWLSQITNFRVGQNEGREDDLFDSATYGIAIGLGNAEGV